MTPVKLTDIQDVVDRAKTIVYIRGAETVEFNNDIFRDNSVNDEFSSYGSLANQVQSSALLLHDFKATTPGTGTLTL